MDNPKFVDKQGTHCDEYPFWKTIQGYKGPLGNNNGDGPGPVPRIMWTHGSQNALQGRALQHFLGTNPTNEFKDVFPSCNIPELTTAEVEAAELLPIPSEMTLIESGFLNVPIGRYVPGSKTVGLCNKPTVP